MGKSDGYKPRLSIEITEEQFIRKQKLIPFYGLQKVLFSTLLDEILNVIEKNGLDFIGPLLNKQVGLSEILPSLKGKGTQDDTGQSG